MGLTHVQKLLERPKSIPFQRLRGSRAEGKSYEKKFGKWLRSKLGFDCHSGFWFQYFDDNGSGLCEVDHFIILPTHTICFECKLTQRPEAEGQLRDLYIPVLTKFTVRPVIGVVVYKFPAYEPARPIGSIAEVLAKPAVGDIFHWNWLP